MSWKITQTTRPKWLAVFGPYDPDFIEDMKAISGAHFNGELRGWMIPSRHRAQLEAAIAKHSPPPVVELLSGAEGVVQLIELADRLGPEVEAGELAEISEALDLVGLQPVVAVVVDGRRLVVAVGPK